MNREEYRKATLSQQVHSYNWTGDPVLTEAVITLQTYLFLGDGEQSGIRILTQFISNERRDI
jgi:hypothetical protein